MSTDTSTVTYRDIPGFPGYRVGDDGSVWSRRKPGWSNRPFAHWRRIHPTLTKQGRLRVSLCQGVGGNAMKKRSVHQLVIEAFVGPCPAGLEACHENDNPKDNRLENLRWDTRKANAADAIRNGKRPRGEATGVAKLDPDKVRQIRVRYAVLKAGRAKLPNGALLKLADDFGVSAVAVLLVVRRKVWAWVE